MIEYKNIKSIKNTKNINHINNMNTIVTVVVLGIVFVSLTMASWLLPPQEFSDSERRKLAQRPKFSLDTMSDGSFMTGFEKYTLDQFPLRDQFRTLKAIINNLSELQDRNLIDGYITMNGAYCFVGEQVIYKSAIPQEEVKAMAAFCEKKGVPCIFVEEHNISVCQPNDMVKKIFYDFLHVNVIPTVSFEEATSKEVIQMTPFITEEEEKEIRPSIPTCEIGRWYPAFADVTAKGDTKQKGIDEIIRYFDIKLEDTMAFGDGGNDISMLRHAAIGVAMGQAKEDVKAAADYVTAPIDEDGISKAMKHFGII